MKPTHLLPFLTLLALPAPLLAQGELDPPGAPAPTMKSLDQVEPRTDIAATAVQNLPGAPAPAAAFIIDQPGAYYLSSNLTFSSNVCIEIRAGGVTLDLMGFTISRAPGLPGEDAGEGDAIIIAENTDGSGDFSDITIRNGHIKGPGIADGITTAELAFPTAVRVTGVSVTGTSGAGIALGDGSTIRRCVVRDAGGTAISGGLVTHCRGESSASTGLHEGINASSVSHSKGRSNAGGAGILATKNVAHCEGSAFASGPQADGIRTTSRGNVSDSHGASSGDAGIESTGNVSNCTGEGPGEGIVAENVTNSRGISDEGDGIRAQGTISHSRGESNAAGDSLNVGLECEIAIGCTYTGGADITNHYNMPAP